MANDNMTFEQSLSELERISKKLESDDITLEESIALFEKGIKLSKECAKKLETAKQRIEKISESSADD